MAKKKRYKLKPRAFEVLFYFLFFIFLVIYSIKGSIAIKDDREYKNSNEYKLIEKG